MAKPLLSLSFPGIKRFDTALLNMGKGARKEVIDVVRETTNRVFRIIKNRTPVDQGNARRAWKKVTRWDSSSAAATSTIEGVITNNVAYINVLEFGGYPGLGPRTQPAPAGEPDMRSTVSRQAPQGMVRVTLKEIEPRFLADVERALDLAISRIERRS